MLTLRFLLAFVFCAYTLNVPELLHAMDSPVQEHAHSHGAEHSHGPQSDVPDASHEHWHCLSCVNGVQVLDQAPDLTPVAGRLSPNFVPPQIVPAQPSASIFHPPA